MIINSADEMFTIVDSLNKNFKVIQQDEFGGKHDCTDYSTLVQDLTTKKFYSIDYTRSYEWGLQWPCSFPVTFSEVEVTEVTSYTWKVKK